MGSGDHFGAEAEANMLYAEERMSEELKKRDRERCDEMRREESLRHEQAYRKGVLTPRGRKLFVFKGASPTVFDSEHYPLATDRDVRRDPLVRRLTKEIEELQKQLPVRHQCPCCGVSRSIECFSQEEEVCDKCNLSIIFEESGEEHLSRIHWQDKATQLERELQTARKTAKANEELATQRGYERDRIQNELLNKKLAKELTEIALDRICAFVKQLPHKSTCPKSATPNGEAPCTCGIDAALGRQPEQGVT